MVQNSEPEHGEPVDQALKNGAKSDQLHKEPRYGTIDEKEKEKENLKSDADHMQIDSGEPQTRCVIRIREKIQNQRHHAKINAKAINKDWRPKPSVKIDPSESTADV